MWPDAKYEENPWRWQFHPDCSLKSFPDDTLSQWNAKTCRELLSALDANQISVTVINAAYRASAAAQLQSEGFTEIALPGSPSISNCAQSSTNVSIDDDTNRDTINLLTPNGSPEHCSNVELEAQAGASADADNFSIMFAAIREESEKRREAALAWQESLIRQTLNENSILEASSLKTKIRDAEFASASKSLEISALEKKIQDEELKTTRRSTDFSVVKAELAYTKVEIHNLKSKLEQASKDSVAEISSLQNELGKANQISKRLHLQLKNDNMAHESKLQKAKNLAFSYSDEASELKIQLQKVETRRNDIENSLKIANAQISTQSNSLSSLKDELEKVQTDLQKQVDTSIALRKGLEAREKAFDDLQLSRNDLQRQLGKSKEDFQDLQRMTRNWKVRLENCEKEIENIQREMSQQVENAKAQGISAGRESAIKDMTEERTAAWRGHLKQIEQVRQEAIEIGRASALEERALSSESPKGLDRARVRDALAYSVF
jgi:chromosome segregation ATPase